MWSLKQECALPQQNVLVDTHEGYVLSINTQNCVFYHFFNLPRLADNKHRQFDLWTESASEGSWDISIQKIVKWYNTQGKLWAAVVFTRKTSLTTNHEFINAGILRFSKCVFVHATLFSIAQNRPSMGRFLVDEHILVFSSLYFVFCTLYSTIHVHCVVIDSRMCFTAAKHLDRHPWRVCFEHKYTK